MSLITETNQQYYQGAEVFLSAAVLPTPNDQTFTTTFDTNLVLGSYDPTETNYALNNFKLYTSLSGLPGTFTEYTSAYTIENNTITLSGLLVDTYVVVQLKSLSGGNYGNQDAFGTTVENNYGGYEYITLNDAIDNFMVGYVGDGKILQKATKSDVLFFAKRSLQEFSYDTLKSIHSQELTIPASLNIVLPQDYINYVSVCYIDELGVKRPIYPANNLTTSPYENPVQDATGVPVQDNFGSTIEGTSITEERWKEANDRIISQQIFNNLDDYAYWANYYGFQTDIFYGQQYGIVPQYAQRNGWFNPNYREGKMSFSSNLVDKLIVLEYISDGLAHDKDTKVPKLAEDALYASILYNIVSTRSGQQEYTVQRLKRDRSSKLRNAKIRLSNIKLDEIVQVMRGKSKWIKH
jgi:hypothetical protein|tara:strand:+ start:1816 stop:3039 length:1224 start_codon:yes stop_codon:yes gene_type:complete